LAGCSSPGKRSCLPRKAVGIPLRGFSDELTARADLEDVHQELRQWTTGCAERSFSIPIHIGVLRWSTHSNTANRARWLANCRKPRPSAPYLIGDHPLISMLQQLSAISAFEETAMPKKIEGPPQNLRVVRLASV